MSEVPVDNGGNDGAETPPVADEFKAIASQDDLNRVINERLTRERAKYADYKDVKAKAARLDEIEAANQTEAEKAAKRIADLEAEMNAVRRDSLRLRIAAEHGITDTNVITNLLTGTDEESLTIQAKLLADGQTERKKNGNHAPREGATPAAPSEGEGLETVRALFGNG